MMAFPGGIEATANGALVLSVAAALFTLLMVERPASLRKSAVKTLAVALLAVLAAAAHGPALLILALALSALGDAFLSREGERAFMAGLTSFLAAHLAYLALFVTGAAHGFLLGSGPWQPIAGGVMVVFAAAMAFVLARRVAPGLRGPIVAYAAAILAMGLSALATRNPWVIAGAVSFIVSDGILATEKFLTAAVSPNRSAMRHAVWITYYVAQLIITLGVVLA